MYRSRGEKKDYLRQLKAGRVGECVFCNPAGRDRVEETDNFYVIRNIYPYSFFDFCRVTDHLLIVPKMHTESIGKISDQAKVEFVKLVDKYESSGYNIYGRTPESTVKTIPHQHTHCIKTDNKKVWFMLFLQKPYLRWMR